LSNISTSFAEWKQRTKSQIVALEVLTNIFAESDEPIEDEDDDTEMQISQNSEMNCPPFVVELIKSNPHLIQILLEKTHQAGEVNLRTVKDWESEYGAASGSNVVSLIQTLRIRALTCFQNILLLPPILFSHHGTETWTKSYEYLWELFFQSAAQFLSNPNGGEFETDFLEALLPVTWTLLRMFPNQLQGNEKQILELIRIIDISLQHQQQLQIQQLQREQLEEISVSGAGILGIFGQQGFNYSIEHIGTSLMRCLDSPAAAVVAESLNSIFDIFAEPQHNGFLRDSNMMNKLASLLPIISNQVKNGKKQLGKEKWGRLDEARINLERFLEYKQAQFV